MRLVSTRLLSFWVLSALSLAATAVQAAPAPAAAQPSPAPAAQRAGAPYVLAGKDAAGKAFDLARQKGRVVMVFYWSTACAVCRDKLPELRANLGGWAGQPFDLVLVSLDPKEADWRAYEQLTLLTRGKSTAQPVSLWAGAPGHRDSLSGKAPKLPLTLVVDPKGQIAQRYEGRMAPEAWDAVAELLP